jgi:DNA modification methylase
MSDMEVWTDLCLGDAREELMKIKENSVDLIVTSPPYADQRKNTYGELRRINM